MWQLHKCTWFFVTFVANFENSLCDTSFPPPFKPQGPTFFPQQVSSEIAPLLDLKQKGKELL